MGKRTENSSRVNLRGLGTLEQRGDIWHMDVMVHGCRYRESTGQNSYQKAVTFLKKRIALIESGQYQGVRAEHTTVAELLTDLYASYVAQKRNLKGIETRMGRIADWFGARRATETHDPAWTGGSRATAVTIPELKRYRDARLSEGVDGPTVNRELAFVRRALNLGAACGKVARMPNFKDSELFLPENPARSGFYEPEQYARLRDYLPADERDVVIAGYWTIMRYETITSFLWDWVDLPNEAIRIPEGVTKNGAAVIIPTGGPGSELHDMLRRRLELRNALCPTCPWVFFHSENRGRHGKAARQVGKQLKTIRKWTDKARKDLGLEDRLFHDFRRTGARDMRRNGTPEGVIMALGGWKTRSTFDRYDIKDERDIREAVQRRVAGAGK